MPRSGLAGATTVNPSSCSRSITPVQLEASAKPPWTRTTVGLAADGLGLECAAPAAIGTAAEATGVRVAMAAAPRAAAAAADSANLQRIRGDLMGMLLC